MPHLKQAKLNLMKSRPMHTLAALIFVAALAGQTTPKMTTPQEALGFNLGDDYQVANYSQLEAWWKKLAAESDRMKLVDIGPTAEGRRQYMAIITSPENMKRLDHYKEISRRLALAEGITEDQARALAREGKAVVWIDGGLHASETVGSQQLMEMVYQMAVRTDPETMRFLNDVILLSVPANPDGQELVANWYMRGSENPDAPAEGPAPAHHGRPAQAVRQVHRPRRQPRLLHVQHAGDHQHEPSAFPGVVSADHVQPPPDRARPAR